MTSDSEVDATSRRVQLYAQLPEYIQDIARRIVGRCSVWCAIGEITLHEIIHEVNPDADSHEVEFSIKAPLFSSGIIFECDPLRDPKTSYWIREDRVIRPFDVDRFKERSGGQRLGPWQDDELKVNEKEYVKDFIEAQRDFPRNENELKAYLPEGCGFERFQLLLFQFYVLSRDVNGDYREGDAYKDFWQFGVSPFDHVQGKNRRHCAWPKRWVPALPVELKDIQKIARRIADEAPAYNLIQTERLMDLISGVQPRFDDMRHPFEFFTLLEYFDVLARPPRFSPYYEIDGDARWYFEAQSSSGRKGPGIVGRRGRDPLTLEEKAIGLLSSDPSLAKQEIARKLACNARQLSQDRAPKFHQAWRTTRAKRGGGIPRGEIDEHGRVQGVDE